jgi:hypothetical protein
MSIGYFLAFWSILSQVYFVAVWCIHMFVCSHFGMQIDPKNLASLIPHTGQTLKRTCFCTYMMKERETNYVVGQSLNTILSY